MLASKLVSIEHSSDIGEARRAVARLAREAAFEELESSRASLVVAEAASNILKHAQRGSVLLRVYDRADARVLEMLAVDNGPGLNSVDASFRDGHSTSGTPGTGLGAIRRSADLVEMYSRADVGTVLLAEIAGGGEVNHPGTSPFAHGLTVGGVCVAKPGESVSGDSWDAMATAEGVKVAVIDGLGHGTAALTASSEAVKTFREKIERTPGEIIEAMHVALRTTRGAAAAVASIDRSSNLVHFAGVGNIAAMIVGSGPVQRMVSHNGIVGHEMRKVQEFTYSWRSDATLLMQSDGLSTQWDPSRYAGLFAAHPSIIAAIAYRDLTRGRDDATAVAVKEWSAR